jgi:putative MATE family efflux protein
MTNSMQNRNHNVLNTDRIGWLLLKLATPAFFAMFVQTLYNVINTIFVGHYVGPLGIAGLSIVFPLQMLIMGLGMMVGIGGASLISRLLGAGDVAGAERTVGNSISISVVLSILVVIIVLPLVDFWLRLIGASDAVLPYARDYLTIITIGAFSGIFTMALLSLARAEGNARVGMVAMILGAALSIILCAVFMIPMNMGVTGAALATVISQIVSMIYLLSYYLTKSSYLKVYTGNLAPDFKILKGMFSIGIASFVQSAAGSLSAMVLINMVVTYGGDYALSAFGIVQRLLMFAIIPGIVIGQGAQPILGFNYGARRYHLALKAIMLASISATLLSILVFMVLYFAPEPLIKIFSNDPQLVDMGAYAAKRMFLALPLVGMVMVASQVFQAIGKAVQAFTTAIVRPIVFLIPLVLTMSHYWQLDGVWLSFPSADMLTFVLIVFLLIPIIRGLKNAAAAEKQENTGPMLTNESLEPVESSRITK